MAVANRRRAFDDRDRPAMFEQQRGRGRTVMRQRDVHAALIDQAEIRKVHAPRRLDVMDRASGASRFEEHAVTVAAQRQDAGDIIRRIGRRSPATARPAAESPCERWSLRSRRRAVCSTGIGQPAVQHMPLWRQA